MKKLSLLVALLLCATIGGVYATWLYAGSEDIADVTASVGVSIEDYDFEDANGTYYVTTNLKLVIDQKNDEHEAELLFKSQDSNAINLTITFVPHAHAPKDVKENAVPTRLEFVAKDMQYKIDANGNYDENGTAVDIFAFNELYLPLAEGEAFVSNITWPSEMNAKDPTNPDATQNNAFSVTFNEDDLKGIISLSQDFVLDLYSEYKAMQAVLDGKNIVATVTDGRVRAQN